MSLDNKKRIITECVTLGMDLDRAMLVAECDESENVALREDASFMHDVNARSAINERVLLNKLDECMELNTAIGRSDEVRWKLERINPSKWGKGGSVGKTNDAPVAASVQIYIPDNGRQG